ncbi:MAG TPA: hypothetical protein VLH19_03525 [Patescibacteria group bacterium]|nr:hypothetical protein [Patescibacteria group bacterium]
MNYEIKAVGLPIEEGIKTRPGYDELSREQELVQISMQRHIGDVIPKMSALSLLVPDRYLDLEEIDDDQVVHALCEIARIKANGEFLLVRLFSEANNLTLGHVLLRML